MANYRYGPYDDGPDPLAPPYDVREALDEMGERILGGDNTRDALRDLLRRGWQDRQGLDDLMRRVRERQRELRNSGRLDGMLEQARELLDEALETERGELFPDPSDDARLREAELDTLPNDTSRAIRQLADYDWRSQAAREKFEQLRDLLRREVLDSQFQGMKQALENPDPAAMQRVKDMLADLRQMLDADTRGEHTQQDFDEFMDQYGDMFPDSPQNLEELVDSLTRRMHGGPAAARVAHRRAARGAGEPDGHGDGGRRPGGGAVRARRRAARPPARARPAAARGADVRRAAARPRRRHQRRRRHGGPGRPGVRPRPGVRGREPGGRRRGGGPPRARPAGGRRPAGAPPARARAAAAGLPDAATAATWSSRRRRSAGSATRRCAGSSPASQNGMRSGDHDRQRRRAGGRH